MNYPFITSSPKHWRIFAENPNIQEFVISLIYDSNKRSLIDLAEEVSTFYNEDLPMLIQGISEGNFNEVINELIAFYSYKALWSESTHVVTRLPTPFSRLSNEISNEMALASKYGNQISNELGYDFNIGKILPSWSGVCLKNIEDVSDKYYRAQKILDTVVEIKMSYIRDAESVLVNYTPNKQPLKYTKLYVSKVYPFTVMDEILEDDVNRAALEVGLDEIVSKR